MYVDEIRKPELVFKVFMFTDYKVEKLVTSKFAKSFFDSDASSTIGTNFYTKDVEIEGKFIRLTVWGWSLKDQFKKLLSLAIRGLNGVILMYDITNTETLNDLSEWCQFDPGHLTESLTVY